MKDSESTIPGRKSPRIPLPKAWTRHVRSAMLYVIFLAQFATVYIRSWAAGRSFHLAGRLSRRTTTPTGGHTPSCHTGHIGAPSSANNVCGDWNSRSNAIQIAKDRTFAADDRPNAPAGRCTAVTEASAADKALATTLAVCDSDINHTTVLVYWGPLTSGRKNRWTMTAGHIAFGQMFPSVRQLRREPVGRAAQSERCCPKHRELSCGDQGRAIDRSWRRGRPRKRGFQWARRRDCRFGRRPCRA